MFSWIFSAFTFLENARLPEGRDGRKRDRGERGRRALQTSKHDGRGYSKQRRLSDEI